MTKPDSVERGLLFAGGFVHSELMCPFCPHLKQMMSVAFGFGTLPGFLRAIRRAGSFTEGGGGVPFPLPRPLPGYLPLPFPLPLPLRLLRLPFPVSLLDFPAGNLASTGTTTGKNPRATRAFERIPFAVLKSKTALAYSGSSFAFC